MTELSKPQAAPFGGSALPTLEAAVLAAAIARIEARGPLDDARELRQALRAAPTRAAQVQARAMLLAERLGLRQQLARGCQRARWLMLGLAVLVALAGLAAGRSVLADDRSINAVAAFVSLLGLHALALLAWLLGLLWASAARQPASATMSFGGLVLGLLARWPRGRNPHAPELLQALSGVVQRARLWPWLAGLVSHTIWALALGLTLAVLLFGFAFQSYRLSWETTILSAGFFQRFVEITGALPHALGFALPDAQSVQLAGQAGAQLGAMVQRDWAWWLIGCVLAYGLLPRLLLLAVSAWRWRAGVARLAAVDMADPAVQRVLRRLDALAPPSQVIDRESGAVGTGAARAASRAMGATGAAAVVGFELPPEQPWPLPGLPTEGLQVRLAGSARERQAVLAQLELARPGALLLAVHGPSSPDRGSARFLREALPLAARTALLAVGEGGAPRWRDWLQAEGLASAELLESTEAAARWVETGGGRDG